MLYLDLAGLTHRHGDDWSPMAEVEANNPDAHDDERKMLAGERVYRCTQCDVEVRLARPPDRIDDR